ncbi:type II secretory pathway protein, partial [Vibrio cyclitrophicus]
MLRVILLITFCLSLPVRASAPAVFESRDTPIAEFVSWFATYTGQTVVLGQGVTGKVSFTAPELKQSEYASFFDSVLRSHGYELG